MIELQPEQFKGPAFQYGPRTKAKPNSQGTLFRVNKSQRKPESRQPKGYSRERLADVSNQLGLTTNGNKYIGSYGMDNGAYEAHQVAQTVARSSIPDQELKGVTVFPAANSISKGSASPAAGQYNSNSAMGPIIKLARGRGDTNTIIHELGHHNNPVDYGHPEQARYAAGRGESEGLADRYKDTHARKPGYKDRKDLDEDYGNRFRPEAWHARYGLDRHRHKEEFNDGYNNSRYQAGFYDTFDKPHPAFGPETIPKSHVQGQLHLIQKTAPIRGDKNSASWRYNF